jgi:hypothetical protein
MNLMTERDISKTLQPILKNNQKYLEDSKIDSFM